MTKKANVEQVKYCDLAVGTILSIPSSEDVLISRDGSDYVWLCLYDDHPEWIGRTYDTQLPADSFFPFSMLLADGYDRAK